MTHKPTTETEIFQAAVSLPAAERRDFLDRACGDNQPLRREVDSLLRAHDPESSFLQSPAMAATVNQPMDEQPGSMIGPYKIREKIGEGGFGVVYVAEQEQPVRRKVALKVIKPGMDSREVVARFEAERQALALMDHPHIAKIFDAGTAKSGRPYFVMELVRGVLITDYCDAHKLPPNKRLELFIQVCHAVQHAHQKGVVHRDLKPSNVLVAPHDGVPVVKVIDFGVAKALGQQLTDKSIYTHTLNYSPAGRRCTLIIQRSVKGSTDNWLLRWKNPVASRRHYPLMSNTMRLDQRIGLMMPWTLTTRWFYSI